MRYSRVEYLYRDASNYKLRGSVVVRGWVEIDKLREYMFDREYFSPETVGLPSLSPRLKNEDDHELHEIERVVPAEKITGSLPAAVLIDRFRRAAKRGWFIG